MDILFYCVSLVAVAALGRCFYLHGVAYDSFNAGVSMGQIVAEFKRCVEEDELSGELRRRLEEKLKDKGWETIQ